MTHDPASAWAGILDDLRPRSGGRRLRVAALLEAAGTIAGSARWSPMYPALVGGQLWIAPRPRGSWEVGMPKVSIRYVVSARRFRGVFGFHREAAEIAYACPPEELEATLEGG
jgi:hypothetical protein